MSIDDRLDVLLHRQDNAARERADIVAQREAILREADEAGLSDLTEEQDQAFRAFTRDIALLDREIEDRNAEIVYLAPRHGVDVVEV